ncbi:TPA: hypothetical protein QCV86_005642 [Bacillus thuringiensis]|nr:hypothetical protein [Bacillus cereus]HDR6828675.1 hypothetical protein [Bacillus thuringiensis]HDR6835046.1 hypothetical protein [Bacillus thuringiensis]HDR6860760.1 hypothetical protein [Bacillus thuringiensis]HDR6905806.1 hypothetical protein [Bacillus thuringiensis]
MKQRQEELLHKFQTILLELSNECEVDDNFHTKIINLNAFIRCIDEIASDISIDRTITKKINNPTYSNSLINKLLIYLKTKFSNLMTHNR